MRAVKTYHQAHKQHKYPYVSFVCTLQVRFKYHTYAFSNQHRFQKSVFARPHDNAAFSKVSTFKPVFESLRFHMKTYTCGRGLSRCLDHCCRSFLSLFEFISNDYKLLELNYFVIETFYMLPFFGIRESPSRPLDSCNFPASSNCKLQEKSPAVTLAVCKIITPQVKTTT